MSAIRIRPRRWRTARSVGLEESLNLFIENLLKRAFTEKARRAEREREQEERRKAEERRKEEQNRERHELAKRESFDRLAEHWRKNEERRAFFEALRGAIGEVPFGFAACAMAAMGGRLRRSGGPVGAVPVPMRDAQAVSLEVRVGDRADPERRISRS
jgi:hypothetical protein